MKSMLKSSWTLAGRRTLIAVLGCSLFSCADYPSHAQARFGGGTGGRGGSTSTGGAVNTRVLAVADEQSNSLVVAVPDTMLPMIEDLVEKLDQPVSDVTELRVFTLKNADPQELADQLALLFPDESRNATGANQQQRFRFGGSGRGRGAAAAASPSQRVLKQSRVLAVADPRTSSLIVSAAGELMPQIERMVEQLDSSAARKQKVFVYSLKNADPQQAAIIMQEMFQRTTTANRNLQNQNSALSSRVQANNQQISTGQANNTGFGGTGLGNSGLGGGGGQPFR
jgi:general secretion pathway protein D